MKKNKSYPLPENFGTFNKQTEQDYNLFKANCIERILANLSTLTFNFFLYYFVFLFFIPDKYDKFKYNLMLIASIYFVLKFIFDIFYTIKILYVLKTKKPKFMYVKYHKSKRSIFFIKPIHKILIKNEDGIIYNKYLITNSFDESMVRTNYAMKLALFELNKDSYILLCMHNINEFYTQEELDKGRRDHFLDIKNNQLNKNKKYSAY